MSTDAYDALCSRLAELARETGADNCSVMDESGEAVYGQAAALTLDGHARAREALAMALAATGDKPLHRGGHTHLVRESEPPFVLCQSFAGIYLLLIWFDAPFDASVARAFVKRAMPEIEALTVSLPPPGGSSTTAGAARMRG